MNCYRFRNQVANSSLSVFYKLEIFNKYYNQNAVNLIIIIIIIIVIIMLNFIYFT